MQSVLLRSHRRVLIFKPCSATPTADAVNALLSVGGGSSASGQLDIITTTTTPITITMRSPGRRGIRNCHLPQVTCVFSDVPVRVVGGFFRQTILFVFLKLGLCGKIFFGGRVFLTLEARVLNCFVTN